ncbi:MAG: helix-turn-helix domain-containing protein [Egibacteraceae bacterium]
MAVIPSEEQDGTGVRGIGDTLRQERVRRGLTLEQAARDAGVPRLVVQGLEQGALAQNDVKTSAYLRMYARSLGLDAEARVRDLTGEELVPGDPAHAEGAGPAWGTPGPDGAMPARRRPQGLWLVLVFVAAALVAAGVTAGVLTANQGAGVDLVAPDVDVDPDGQATGDPDAGDPDVEDPDADTGPARSPTPDPEPEPTPEPEPEPEPAGRAPEDTRVQVLHGPEQAPVVDDVVATLEAMGYQVVRVSAARTAFPSTTVLYSEGWEPEAEALAARDARFAEVAANSAFSAEVHLHVGVGPDWPVPDEERA